MTITLWLSLAGVCVAGAMSPGPSLAVVVRAAVGGGVPAGLAAAWAHALGVALYALLTVLGFSALLAAAPQLLTALQLAGALYLLYLASRLLRSDGSAAIGEGAGNAALHRAAIDGFAVAFLNPKLALFMLALFSQFIRPEFGPAELGVMVLTVGCTDGGWYSLVALLLTRPRPLAALQARSRFIDRVFGFLIAALALSILGSALL